VEDVNGSPQPRRYRSVVREEGARRTRRAIVVAAGQLFEQRGYGGTSLSEVAAAAGVARPTVTAAFGSKPALLREVVNEALAGDDEPVPVADRPWFRPIWDAQTHHELLGAYAQVCTLIGARAARVFEVVRRAADASPDVAELWDTTQHNRRAGAGIVVKQLRSLGPVDGWPGDEQAVDVVWFFNDPAHYNTLVLDCGWREPAFAAWLTARMQDALINGRRA
jgi:AcrR family transcriptional regulator